MFKVANADFIADKLAEELLPHQEDREAFKNAEEAIRRRLELGDDSSTGRIEFDVDWPLFDQLGAWYLSCADNGDGMSRSELQRYTTTLAVEGANKNQSIAGNQGMGLKISGPTRHKEGVLIRSLKDGEHTMVQVGWDGSEYGLIPIGPDEETVVSVGEDMFPEFIIEHGSGTVVTFLGNASPDNTFAPTDRTRGWLFKYLNQRFYELSTDGIEVFVRVPSGDEEDWPRSLAEATDRMAGKGGKSFNLSKVKGTASVWSEASDRQGSEFRGVLDLPGAAADDVPPARMHWWVLPTGKGSDVSSRTASGGSIAVLFQNELHDWRTGSQANPFFARLGVLFGKTRIAFVLEPVGTVASDFARAHVLVGGKPVFETDAWTTWADQFRAELPEAIQKIMAEEQARLQQEDPDRARRIRDRLKDVMSLLRPKRWRAKADGDQPAGGPSATGPGTDEGHAIERGTGPQKRKKKRSTRGLGAVLTQVDDEAGEPAQEVFSILRLDPKWVTESEASGFPLVNGNGNGIHDRAAALAGEDGATADILLLNTEFRGYQTILAAVNEWANPEGDDDKVVLIEKSTQEWVEQKMVEAVNGLRQLENGSTWVATNFDEALSPVALTAAFMADRYHTLREVKRQAGKFRSEATA
ncbi:MAG: hypothetical protein GY788_01555 [bacterium]|nr:hypothetical protein [bacterium]